MKTLLLIIALSCAAAAQTTTGLEAGPISIGVSVKADVVYKAIGELAGVTVVIDPDFRPQKISVHLTNVTVPEALDVVGLQSKTVWRAVTPNIILVNPKDAR